MSILDTRITDCNGGSYSLRDFFENVLGALILDGEYFSSKRPLGNSGWMHELAVGLVEAGHIEGTVEYSEEGYVDDVTFKLDDCEKALLKAVTILCDIQLHVLRNNVIRLAKRERRLRRVMESGMATDNDSFELRMVERELDEAVDALAESETE